MMFLHFNFVSNSNALCPQHITTYASNPYIIMWHDMTVDFSRAWKDDHNKDIFMEDIKNCAPNTYPKLLHFVETQTSIWMQREDLSIAKRWIFNQQWESQLSFAYYDFWLHYAEETQNSLIWGASRVRGGLISTAQGSDLITDYLYIQLSSKWKKYDLIDA